MSDAVLPKEPDFGRLFAAHQPRIYGFIRSLVPHRSDAEDILQETASVLWQNFKEFQPETSFLAWAIQVARFQVMSYRTKTQRSVLRFSTAAVEALSQETLMLSEPLADLREALSNCMEKLSAVDRHLFEQRYQGNKTSIDVAREINRPPTTVYNALARIRRSLVECIARRLRMEEHS